MRGRPPKPTKLKLLNGNPGGRPLNDAEPRPGPGLPKCPSFLDSAAKAEWKETCDELAAMGLLAKSDKKVIASLCQAWATFKATTERLRKEGRYYTVRGYEVARTAVAEQREAMKQIREFSSVLGLDPSSRTRIHVPPKDAKRDDFEAFVGIG